MLAHHVIPNSGKSWTEKSEPRVQTLTRPQKRLLPVPLPLGPLTVDPLYEDANTRPHWKGVVCRAGYGLCRAKCRVARAAPLSLSPSRTSPTMTTAPRAPVVSCRAAYPTPSLSRQKSQRAGDSPRRLVGHIKSPYLQGLDPSATQKRTERIGSLASSLHRR